MLSRGPNCNTTFVISFFVPYLFRKDDGPPAPTDNTVFVETIGPLTVGVSEFGGFANQSVVVAEAAKLEQQIQNSESLKVDEDNFGDQWFFAGYDPPFRLSGRHNEVWVPVVEL